MPKVSVNNDPLLERLIFAYDGTSYRVVKCDTDGNVVAALKAGQSVEVTQDTAADLKATVNVAAAQTIAVTQATAASLKALVDLNTDQNVQARGYGYDGATWQKLSLLFGYSDTIKEGLTNTSMSAGTNWLNGAAVPSGKVYVITNAIAFYVGTALTTLEMFVNLDGANIRMIRELSPTSSKGYGRSGEFILKAGDYMRAAVTGATAGDSFYFDYSGFVMAVT